MAEEMCRAALRKCRYNGRIFLEMVGQSEGVERPKMFPPLQRLNMDSPNCGSAVA